MITSHVTLDKIISLCKRRGFVFPSSEIYSGLNGVYDFGPLGTLLKQNIKGVWLEHMMSFPEEVVLLDGAILGAQEVWKASGHVDNFSDPLIDCIACKKRFRADEFKLEEGCPNCKSKELTDVRQFKLMFQTQVGAVANDNSIAYLRPETAQSIFVNFKNVVTSCRSKIPFGIAQIGKAFRNEITPKQFLFRMREFEQMELEFFCKCDESDKFFDLWVSRRINFFKSIGLNSEKIRTRAHTNDELAHYAKACCDVEYNFPFGWKEVEGIANRTDFDLVQHSKFSGKDLAIFDEGTKTSYAPHVIECSIGVDRLFLTLLFDAFFEDEVEGEPRVVLKFHPKIAPVTAAILPLTNKLREQSEKIFINLKSSGFRVQYDVAGSIGKRYRRQDEIGTPVCFTYDFDSIQDRCVTARNRDTLQQDRIAIDQLSSYLNKLLEK